MGIHEKANRVRRDAYPDAAWAAVKMAIRQTVARAGGVEAVAAQCRVAHKARVSEWQNPHGDDFPNLWQVGQLEALAGVDWVTQAMAALHGADLVKRGSVEIEGELLDRIGVAARESGEATASAADAVGADATAATIRAAIRECNEAIRAKRALCSTLEAMLAEAV